VLEDSSWLRDDDVEFFEAEVKVHIEPHNARGEG